LRQAKGSSNGTNKRGNIIYRYGESQDKITQTILSVQTILDYILKIKSQYLTFRKFLTEFWISSFFGKTGKYDKSGPSSQM
jgi:hypothetical protein